MALNNSKQKVQLHQNFNFYGIISFSSQGKRKVGVHLHRVFASERSHIKSITDIQFHLNMKTVLREVPVKSVPPS